MVPRLSSSELCSVEFSVLPLCGAALLEAKFEESSVELRDAASWRELCDDEILEVELAADEFWEASLFCAAVSQNGEQSSAKESKILPFFIKILFRFYNLYQFTGGIILQFFLNSNKIFNKLNHKILYAITNLTEFNKIYWRIIKQNLYKF